MRLHTIRSSGLVLVAAWLLAMAVECLHDRKLAAPGRPGLASGRVAATAAPCQMDSACPSCGESGTHPGAHPGALPEPEPGALAAADIRVLAALPRWLAEWRDAGCPDDRVAAGIAAARARRPLMARLIDADPREALAQALSWDEYLALPAQVRDLAERPFSLTGDLMVLPVCDAPGHGDTILVRHAGGGEPWVARVFGRRQGGTSKYASPLQGIVLGGVAALHEEPLQLLSPAESAALADLLPSANPDPQRDFGDASPLGPEPLHALGGGRLLAFASDAAARAFITHLAGLDVALSPHEGAGRGLAAAGPLLARDGAPGDDEPQPQNLPPPAGSWSTGQKKLLAIRVDFSDQPGAIATASDLQEVLDTTVAGAIGEMSFGKTSLLATVTPQTYRLPQPATHYLHVQAPSSDSRNVVLMADARNLAAAHHNLAQFDLFMVVFKQIGMISGGVNYAGLAQIAGTESWIQGTISAKTITHELGHNLGLAHASHWLPSGSSPVGPGSNQEYGDPFDLMGSGPVDAGHFHPQGKQRLGWLEPAEWGDASAAGSGRFRVHRIDHPAAIAGLRGLRVTKGADEYYWLGYRQLFPETPALFTGIPLYWQRPGENRCWLVDTTPGSPGGTADAGLRIGRTYSDPLAAVHLTPVARGGTAPAEWVDVQVNLGSFPGNSAPVVSLAVPATPAARSHAAFTATASDPDGDELAYFWDFGDGSANANSATVYHAWKSGGTHTVTVTVSDMKGGVASASQVVSVSDPLAVWTSVPSGTTLSLHGIHAGNTLLVAVGGGAGSYGVACRSTNGTTWTKSDVGARDWPTGYNVSLKAITRGPDAWVAVGEDYNFDINAFVGVIYRSSDAATWTRAWLGPAGSELRDVAYGSGRFVAAGFGGRVATSTDGITWTASTPAGTVDLTGVAYGNGRFAVVGLTDYYAGTTPPVCLWSADGLAWTALNRATDTHLADWQYFLGIDFAGSRFHAGGWYANLGRSEDGSNWQAAIPAAGDLAVNAFAHGNGVTFGVGTQTINGSQHQIQALSTDQGQTWTLVPAPAGTPELRSVAYFNNRFATVGPAGSIRVSDPVAPAVNYFAWQEQNFPGNPAGSLPGDDWDRDGIANFLEYALGRDPRAAFQADGAGQSPRAGFSGDAPLAGRLALTLDLPDPLPPDLIYEIEAGGKPGDAEPVARGSAAAGWVWLAGGTPRILIGDPVAGRRTVRVGDPLPAATAPRRFMHLRPHLP
jgi:M6 family metalloprotease-like protein